MNMLQFKPTVVSWTAYTLQVDVVSSSEMSVSIYQSAWCHIQEALNNQEQNFYY